MSLKEVRDNVISMVVLSVLLAAVESEKHRMMVVIKIMMILVEIVKLMAILMEVVLVEAVVLVYLLTPLKRKSLK